MKPVIIPSPRDEREFAALTSGPEGVLVQLCCCTSATVETGGLNGVWRIMASATIDAPFHVVADRAHGLLCGPVL